MIGSRIHLILKPSGIEGVSVFTLTPIAKGQRIRERGRSERERARRMPQEHAQIGPHLGFVSVFDLNGNFLKRLVSMGKLNAPWGLALAPSTFGTFANTLLIGNLGDGRITAYDRNTGAIKGQLADSTGKVIALPGLWGLRFGNGGQGGTKGVLYFTSGPSGYAHGRFGSIAFQ